MRFTERLDEIGARPSIGTVADSYDNALAETTNGLYKTECVRGPDAPAVWDDVDQLELETLSWVHWFNEDAPRWYEGAPTLGTAYAVLALKAASVDADR